MINLFKGISPILVFNIIAIQENMSQEWSYNKSIKEKRNKEKKITKQLYGRRISRGIHKWLGVDIKNNSFNIFCNCFINKI